MPSRGNAISAYSPAFSKGAQVYGANIASGVVTSAHIATGTVVAGDIGAGSVTSAKIGTGAVTSIKFGAASVISAKIGAGAVVSAALGTASVTNAKMKAAFLSGTVSGLTSGVVAIAHGLGVKPKFVIVGTMAAHADIIAGTANAAFLAAASAATTTNFYIKTTKGGNVKYTAYVQI